MREDSVGPFHLGLIPPTPKDTGNTKKWSELNTRGKVVRTTARASNLVVILFGAGLSAVLIYALTSEMFSKNSPTVLYGKACELIKSSTRVAKYIDGPLTFHNNPPTGIRPRHRNHHLSSQIAVDSSGREHMLLHFFVQGQTPGSVSEDSESYLNKAMASIQSIASEISEMSLDEVTQEINRRSKQVFESCKRMFRFLSGDDVSTPSVPSAPHIPAAEEKKPSGWMSGFTGMFSGLKGVSGSSAEHTEDVPSLPTETEGEVHADLIMNDQGFFEFRYLLIDFPDSQSRNPRRVFVIRSNGVRESERVMRWNR